MIPLSPLHKLRVERENFGQSRRPFKTQVDRGEEEAKGVGNNRKRDLQWRRNMGEVARSKNSVLPIGIVTVGRPKDSSAHGNQGSFQEGT